MDNKHNSLNSSAKICSDICSWTSSVPRSSQFSLLGTDNVRGQISEHIFPPNEGYCLYVILRTCAYLSVNIRNKSLEDEVPCKYLLLFRKQYGCAGNMSEKKKKNVLEWTLLPRVHAHRSSRHLQRAEDVVPVLHNGDR